MSDKMVIDENQLSLRYKEILAAYLVSGQEAHLYQVNQLSKDLMKQGISPETVVEMHLEALRKVNKDIGAYPKDTVDESFRFLIEGINAYGVAYKEYLDSRTDSYVAEIKELNRRVSEKLTEMTALYETVKITGSSLDLEDVLSSVFENTVKTLKAENGSLMLLDPEEGVLIIKKAYGLDEEVIRKTRIKIGDSIAGLVAQSGESMIIHGKVDSSLIIGREKYENVYSICAPLKAKKGIIGVINLNRKGDSDPFMGDNLKLLSAIAHEAAFAIENARLYEAVQKELVERKQVEENLLRSEKRYKRLVESVTDYIYTVEVEEGNATATSHGPGCVAVTGYTSEEYASNPDLWYRMIYEEDRKDVIEQAARALSGEAAPPLEHRIVHKNGSIRWVMNTTVPRYGEDGRLIAYDSLIRDITERKRAEEKIKQEMDVIASFMMIAHATAHITDMDKLMEQVIYCAQKIMRCDICLSYFWDKETNVFRPRQAYGLSHEQKPFFNAGSLDEEAEFVKKTLESKEVMLGQFGLEGSEFGVGSVLQWIKDIDTSVVIPLFIRKEKLGLIIAVYKKHREFSGRDKKIMEGISHQVSVALEQARLYRDSIDRAMELSRRIETIRSMHGIDRAILSTLKTGEVLETAIIMISKVVSCNMATVTLADKEKGEFTYTAGFGLTFLQKGTIIPFKDTSAAKVVSMGSPQYVANLEKVKDILPFEKRLLDEGFLSLIRVPLIVKGEVVGVLSISVKKAAAFTPEDLLTLEKFAGQLGIALKNAWLLADLEELFLGTVKSLSSAIDAKSPWTKGHSERVTEYSIKIGKEMGLEDEDLDDLKLAGLLHDIGKIGTYDSILDKPGKLTDEEYEVVKKHPVIGSELLSSIKQLSHIIPWVRAHHERLDGKGYPDGLKGEEIPLQARILLVADTFDSMTAERPYRKTPGRKKMIEEIKRYKGIQFDPKVVEAFLKILENEGKTEHGS